MYRNNPNSGHDPPNGHNDLPRAIPTNAKDSKVTLSDVNFAYACVNRMGVVFVTDPTQMLCDFSVTEYQSPVEY